MDAEHGFVGDVVTLVVCEEDHPSKGLISVLVLWTLGSWLILSSAR